MEQNPLQPDGLMSSNSVSTFPKSALPAVEALTVSPWPSPGPSLGAVLCQCPRLAQQLPQLGAAPKQERAQAKAQLPCHTG